MVLSILSFEIKQNNHYMFVETEASGFLDIKIYIAPGLSYEKLIKAYDVSQTKLFFPHECVDSLDQINHPLPNHQAFYSSCKLANIAEEKL